MRRKASMDAWSRPVGVGTDDCAPALMTACAFLAACRRPSIASGPAAIRRALSTLATSRTCMPLGAVSIAMQPRLDQVWVSVAVLPHFRCKWSVVVACRLGRRYSRGVKKAAAKQVEFGAAVRLPLEQFQPVDLAFDGTIAPRLRQGSPNRRKVANNSGNEAVQRRGSRRGQPNLERRRIPLAQNAAEFIDCRRRGADLGYESS